jgi:hypothetical protein
VIFVFASINVLRYIYGFMYVEPSLHPWHEAELVLVNDLSDVLDLVCHYSLEYFCIAVHYGDWPTSLFLAVSLSGFGMSAILAS